ncbi:MAG TPA: S8 family serine peptidase, partial [Flavisolibacter sp.]|nr:S8 family serine peptidase [Flavisolibacter sp.]
MVRFKDKVGTQFSIADPSAYLSSRSIARRTRYNIAIDSTDLPVSAAYIQSLRNIPNVTILNISKWLNQVSIQTSDPAAITAINSLPFVRASMPIAARLQQVAKDPADKFESTFPSTKAKVQGVLQSDHFNYGQSDAQVHIHNGAFLHNIGLRGQNMIISMLDAGFFLYTSLKAFDSVNKNGQVLGTYDFVNRELSVVEDNAHGMNCFSIIAANIPGEFVGTAPKANFYLYRSEEAATEYPIEEHNWVCAAERTDSVGGDVISSSLGYTTFDNPVYNHTYAEMNGNTTMAAIGADLAAKKGILVFNSAGNDGDKPWKFISTPADADSIVAVGAINVNGVIAAFSSFGPSSDGQVKPDVVSVGVSTVLQGTNNTISRGNGTSFSCPNIAGLATCLWQGFQEFNNMKIIQALRQSSNNFNTPNDRLGYGIPDMKKATMLLIKDFATSNAQLEGCKPVINWTSKDAKGMKYEIERRGPGETSFTKIGEQISTTTLFANQTYRFTDPSTFSQSGPAIYRIRQFI